MKDALLKNWKTSLIGFASIGAALYMFVTGHPWPEVAGAAAFGAGMLMAKDAGTSTPA